MFKINNIISLSIFLTLISLSTAAVKSPDDSREYNPFSSTYQFWSPITNLVPNSKLIPLHIGTDNENVDLVVNSPNGRIEWYNNIRGLGQKFFPFPISQRNATDFIPVNYQTRNSTDVAYIDLSRENLFIAENPFRTHPHRIDENYNKTWNETSIFSVNGLANNHLNIPSIENYFITSMIKVDHTFEESIMISLENVNHKTNTQVLMLERNNTSSPFYIGHIFPLDSPASIKLVDFQNLDNEGIPDIIAISDGKLYAILDPSDSASNQLHLISNITFPDSYNFKHTHWVSLTETSAKSLYLIHPLINKLGVIVNTWNDTSYPTWEFLEIVHYSLQVKSVEEGDASDCIILYPKENRTVYDFLCVSSKDLRYYIQDESIVERSLPKNSWMTVQMNVFHDMPLHLIVWNTTIRHDHIFYLRHTEASTFLLYSSSQGIVSWVEKNKIALDSVGWVTNFWILIMIYCLILSIIAGVIHTIVQNYQYRFRREGALLDKRSPSNAAGFGGFGFGPNRRTTV